MIEGVSVVGHLRTCQNVVFKVICGGQLCILRLTDPDHRSRNELCIERALLTDLQPTTTSAVQPVSFPPGDYIHTVSYEGKSYNGMLFSYVDGCTSDVLSHSAAELFGSRLAELHAALGKLQATYDLPYLEQMSASRRLIHGDFNPTNVLTTSDSYVVIDFENACYASYEYEISNSIYMTLFDHRDKLKEFIKSGFLEGFLAGYAAAESLDLFEVRRAIDARVAKLGGWLSDPTSAPMSITASTETWRRELSQFVSACSRGAFDAAINSIA